MNRFEPSLIKKFLQKLRLCLTSKHKKEDAEAKSLVSNILDGFIEHFESNKVEKKETSEHLARETLSFIRFVLDELVFNVENSNDVIFLYA